jgi:hypothetical protein
MTAPKEKKLEPPADSEEDDGAADMYDDADHLGRPLRFDEDGNVLSGEDPEGA